jgi:hypothetical protein
MSTLSSTLMLEPIRAKARNESADPQFTNCKMETALPNLAVERNDIELASDTSPSTERLPPMYARANNDTVDPSRAIDRKLILDPRWQKSHTDMVLPKRAIERTEKDEPTNALCNTDS